MANDRIRLGVATILVTMTLPAASVRVRAQEASSTTEGRPIVLVGAGYASPTRWTGGLGVLIPFGTPKPNGDLGDVRGQRGLEVDGGVGAGGARLAVGPAWIGKPPSGPVLFKVDVLAEVTRTWNSPRSASADSTYAGLEGSWMVLMVRLSAGVAHRVAGPAGPDATIFTWSAGMQTGW
jgi:hypothetical protein